MVVGVLFARPSIVSRLAVGSVREDLSKIMDLAMRDVGALVVGLIDLAAARIQEGVEPLAGYAEIFTRNVLASAWCRSRRHPGFCAGGAVYSPAMTDFIATRSMSSYMFITAPTGQSRHPRRSQQGRSSAAHARTRDVLASHTCAIPTKAALRDARASVPSAAKQR